MKSSRSQFLALLVMAVCLAPVSSYATNGSLLIGVGAKSRAMGGVNVAYFDDGLASAFNPAGLVDVGTRADVGAMLFRPDRSAFVPGFSGKPEVHSGSKLFLLPNMGGAMKFNRKLSIGFAGVPFGGGSTRYTDNFFDFAGDPEPTLGVWLAQMIMAPGAGYKLNKQNSVGASLLIGVQQFRGYGFGAFGAAGFSSDRENLTNRGNDYAYGAGVRLGWRGKYFDDRLVLGATYSSKVYMTKFDKYKGLFADEGSFDMPENYGFGIAVKPLKKLTLAFDYQRVLYHGIRAISNDGPVRLAPLPPEENLLGEKEGLGFGWDNMSIYKLGVSFDYNPKWTLRAGYNYAKNPIPDSQILFSTVAPAVVEHHATAGFTYKPTKKTEWTISGMHAFRNSQVAFNEFSGDNIRLQMTQWALDISFGYKIN